MWWHYCIILIIACHTINLRINNENSFKAQQENTKNLGRLWLAYTELQGDFYMLHLESVNSGHFTQPELRMTPITASYRKWACLDTITYKKGSWAEVDWKCPTFLSSLTHFCDTSLTFIEARPPGNLFLCFTRWQTIRSVMVSEHHWKKKWSQNGSTLEPFWKSAPLFKSGAVFSLIIIFEKKTVPLEPWSTFFW